MKRIFLIFFLALFLIGSFFINSSPALAQKHTTNADVNLSLMSDVGEVENGSGNTFAQLNAKWNTNVREDVESEDSLQWFVSVKNITDNSVVWTDHPLAFSNFSQQWHGTGIGWNKKMEVTVKLINNDLNYRVIGQRTATLDMGPPQANGGASAGTGQCPVKSATWSLFGNTNNNVVFKWQMPSGAHCSGPGTSVTIYRPDGSIVDHGVMMNRLNDQDGSAMNGDYEIDSCSTANTCGPNSSFGAVKVTVNLAQANTPSVTTDPNDPWLNGGLTNSSTLPSFEAQCKAKCPSGYIFNMVPSMYQVLCETQCVIIDWMATMINAVVDGVLVRVLT